MRNSISHFSEMLLPISYSTEHRISKCGNFLEVFILSFCVTEVITELVLQVR